jgi:hypothetical protein
VGSPSANGSQSAKNSRSPIEGKPPERLASIVSMVDTSVSILIKEVIR